MKENNWSIQCLIKQQYCFVNGILVRITEVPRVFFERIDLYLYHKFLSLCLTWKVVSRRISNHYCGIKYTRWWGVWNDRKCVSDSAVVWLPLFHETEVKCFEYFSLQTVFALKDIFIFLTPWNEAMFWNVRYPENRKRKKLLHL